MDGRYSTVLPSYLCLARREAIWPSSAIEQFSRTSSAIICIQYLSSASSVFVTKLLNIIFIITVIDFTFLTTAATVSGILVMVTMTIAVIGAPSCVINAL